MAPGITIELSYMSPVPQPWSASDFLLLTISSIADTPTINKDLASLTFSSINLWTITTSILLRWRLSLSLTVPNVFIGILILYLCVKLFAEPVEKVPGHLNPFAKKNCRRPKAKPKRSDKPRTMSIEIVPLAQTDIPGAVDCVQKAFADDPYFRWAFDDPSKFNIQRNAASLAAHLRYGINCGCPISVAKITRAANESKSDGEIRLPAGTVVGVAWWYSPQAPSTTQTWSVWAQDWLLSFRQLMNNIRFLGRGGLNVHRYWIWKQVQQTAHDTIWQDPRGYYFCNVVCVDSEARGMGVGKKLMENVMEKADRENMPCYLESSKGYPNVGIYERMGFELVKEIECVDGGDVCKLYCMIRNPKSKE